MVVFPNCKINIGLYVTNKRADGYHDLETVFYPVKLHDVLEIVPAEMANIFLQGDVIAGDKHNNLVWKAYELLKSRYPEQVTPVAIHLLKSIPMGAGMGGGSADGAFMLRLMNTHYKLGLDDATLAAYALELGSDCPFFIYDTPQYACGRGEQMQPITIDLSAYSIQLVCPGIHVSTAVAFESISPEKASYDLRKLPELPIEQWKDVVNNDFEDPVFAMHPELAAIKQALYDQGAIYAAMSGSGSTVYGIFKEKMDMKPEGCENYRVEWV